MVHVKAVKKANPSKSLKDVLKMAAKSYKKDGASKKGAKVSKTSKTYKKSLKKMGKNMGKKKKSGKTMKKKAKKSGKKSRN